MELNLSDEMIANLKRATGKRTADAAIIAALETVAANAGASSSRRATTSIRKKSNTPNAATAAALRARASKDDTTFDTPADFSKWLRSIPRR